MTSDGLFTQILSGQHSTADTSWRCVAGLTPPHLARWIPRVSELEGVCPPMMERELPRGDISVVIYLAGDRALLDLRKPGERRALAGAWISGLQDHSNVIASGGRAWFCFAQLTPEGAYRAFGVPPSELVNSIVPLEEVLGIAARDLVSRIHAAPSAYRRIELLGRFLLERAAAANRWDAVVGHALRRITVSHGTLGVTSLAKEVGWSRKHLHRRMVHFAGLGPSRWSRIARFHAALIALHRTTAVNLADVSYALGYYDQAHFSHEFRALADMTPTEYLRTRAFSLDHGYVRIDASH